MGKHRKSRTRRARLESPRVGLELAQVFFGAGAVPLTADLVDRLVARGWQRSQLEAFRRLGALYSLPRDSIVFPPSVEF